MKKLGFLIVCVLMLTPTYIYASDIAKIKIGKVEAKKTSNRFDTEGRRYYTVTAEKDQQMITFDFTATSTSKNPTIPTLYVGKIDGKYVSSVVVPYVKFKKWEQYGSYIGLYHDDGNDFAMTDTVNFSAFAPVPKKEGEYVVFTDGTTCYIRQENKRERPPVWYEPLNICSTKLPISLDGMEVLGKVRVAKR